MVDASIRGTILIVFLIAAGVALMLVSGISILSNPVYLDEPQTPVPTIPVTAVPTQIPTEISATQTIATVVPTKIPVTATPATSIPTQALAANDPVLGTWTGTKTLNILFITAEGEGTVTFRDDYTGHVSGGFRGAGMDETFSNGFSWTNNGGGSYTGIIGSESLAFSLAGETLTMTINPKQLGVASLDMNIPVEMHR